MRQRFDSVFDALGTVEEHMTEAEGREELEVEPVIPPQVFSHGGARPQSKSFAASTADASGMTKQAINRHLARAEALGDDLDKVTGTSTLSRDSCFASTEAPAVGLFFCLVLGGIPEIVLHPPLHRTGNKKPRYRIDSGVSFAVLVPER